MPFSTVHHKCHTFSSTLFICDVVIEGNWSGSPVLLKTNNATLMNLPFLICLQLNVNLPGDIYGRLPGMCGDRKYDVLTELIIGELSMGGIQMCTGDIIGIRHKTRART